MSFTQNLRYLRRKANLTQTELGEKLGVDYATIGNYESGKSEPRLELLGKLASAFSVSIEQLKNADLTKSIGPLSEEPASSYTVGKVQRNPFAPLTKPVRHKISIMVELDGTMDGLERIFTRLTAFNDTVAETD